MSTLASLLWLVAAPVAFASDNGVGRAPPMGWNSWNHFHCSVTADLLRQTADDFVSLGLTAAGYTFINTDDCWSANNQGGRSTDGRIIPSDTFGNVSQLSDLADYIHSKGMKFGIYGAAGQTTCAGRVGSLYHERTDAQSYADWGVDYLKYDNCGEVNIQSYAKFSAMADALNATGRHIFYSYEPHLTVPINWTRFIGNAWRTGHDIGSSFSSMFSDLAINNAWATVGGPGGWNDADMLEVGNSGLSIAEQRVHFALWCMAKSPLLIGSDVRSIQAESLAILKNEELIAVNQDALGQQAALVKATPVPAAAPAGSHTRAPVPAPAPAPAPALGAPISGASAVSVAAAVGGFNGMTTCDYGPDVPVSQKWSFTSGGQIKQGEDTCLLATSPPALGSCTSAAAQSVWHTGRANVTTAQIKTLENPPRCLKYIGPSFGIEATGLFLDTCNTEPPICQQTRCASSTLVNELWYLSRHGQLIASYTTIPIPPLAGEGEGEGDSWKSQVNPPYCLATAATSNPPQEPPLPSYVRGNPDITQCLQVWAGPLSGNDTVVGLVNSCSSGSQVITATWDDIGVSGRFAAANGGAQVACSVRDMYAGKDLPLATGNVSATVDEHDIVALRLTCPAPES